MSGKKSKDQKKLQEKAAFSIEGSTAIENRIIRADYESEMKQDFIDYAMSVIIQRALPDIRDGLKPVHRRIMYAMNELGFTPDKPHKKSATTVGEVLGKYHPHGDASVYDAMVRMAQDFSLRHILVDGHGNFGSIDGDSSAHMRYTEARLSPIALELLSDLEKGVVAFTPNYDESLKEPEVLPARFPNLLVNGSSGIAVGMATEIPQHNLLEVVNACVKYIDNPDISIEELLKEIKGPDFPSGGIIINKRELLKMYTEGKGKLKIRAKLHTEDMGYGVTAIVVTEIPHTQAGRKSAVIEKIAELIKDRKLEEISDIRDESNREGMRIVLTAKRNEDIPRLISKLYKKTPLQDEMHCIFLALVNKAPRVLNIKQIISYFIDFQKELTFKKYKYILEKSQNRKEVLDGLIKAYDLIDAIIAVIRGSKNIATAKECLITGDTSNITFKIKSFEKIAKKFTFTERQAEAILGMRLSSLIGLELEKLNKELGQIEKEIDLCISIINSDKGLKSAVKKYLKEIAAKYGNERRTVVEDVIEEEYKEEFKEEELYILIDRFQYIKAIDAANYSRCSEESLAEFRAILKAKNTDKICFFTKEGNLHSIKTLLLPKVKIKEKGVPLSTLCKIEEEEVLKSMILPSEVKHLIFITRSGYSKMISVSELATNRVTIASTNLEKDDIISCILDYDCEFDKNKYLIIITENSYVAKIPINQVPELKKTSKGANIIKLNEKDKIAKAFILGEETKLILSNGKIDKEINLKTLRPVDKNSTGRQVIPKCKGVIIK